MDTQRRRILSHAKDGRFWFESQALHGNRKTRFPVPVNRIALPTVIFHGRIVPRIQAIPATEQRICARFREARQRSKIKQADLARAVGINPDRLAGYEHGRNPMPYGIGENIAEITDTCQRWLFNGELPVKPFLEIDLVVIRAVPEKALFSDVCKRLLLKPMEEFLLDNADEISRMKSETDRQEFGSHLPLLSPPAFAIMKDLEMVASAIALEARLLSLSELQKFFRELEKLCDAHLYKDPIGVAHTWREKIEHQRLAIIEKLKNEWNAAPHGNGK